MTFKEQIAHDINNVFINGAEFSDMHNVNGKDMLCQVDTNELVDRERRYKFNHSLYGDGVYLKETLIYVKGSDLGKLPTIGRSFTLDGKVYIVSDAIDEDGIYSISLEANKT